MAGILSNGTGGGLWSDTATWAGGVVPAANNANVLIVAGDTVTVDGTYYIGDEVGGAGTLPPEALRIHGTVLFSRSVNSHLRNRGTLIVDFGGVLDAGTEASPIPPSVTCLIETNDSAVPAHSKYDFRCPITAALRTSSSFVAPKITMHGATVRRVTFASASALSGETSIDVLDLTGWEVGRRIMVAGTDSWSGANAHLRNELVTITAITPGVGTAGTVSWVGGLLHDHAVGCAVAYFDSNVTVAAVVNGFRGGSVFAYWGGTTPVGDFTGTFHFQYVHFENLGNGGGNALQSGGSTGAGIASTPYDDVVGCSFYQLAGNNSNCIGIQGMRYLRKTRIIDCAMYAGDGSAIVNTNGASNVGVYRCYMGHGGTARGSIATSNTAPVDLVFEDCWFPQAREPHFSSSWGPFTFRRCRFMSATAFLAATFHSIGRPVLFTGCWIAAQDIGTPSLPNFFAGSTFGNASTLKSMTWRNCIFQPGLNFRAGISAVALFTPDAEFVLADIDQDPLQQEVYTALGNIFRDNSISRDPAGSSLAMYPRYVDLPLSLDLSVFAPNSQSVLVAGFVRRSDAGVVATITLSGLGIAPVVQTISGAAGVGTWQQFGLTAIQSSGANSLLTLTLEGGGDFGTTCHFDSISAPPSVAIDTGEMSSWFNGYPANTISANFVTASDVWNVLASQLTLPGSVGEVVAAIPNNFSTLSTTVINETNAIDSALTIIDNEIGVIDSQLIGLSLAVSPLPAAIATIDLKVDNLSTSIASGFATTNVSLSALDSAVGSVASDVASVAASITAVPSAVWSASLASMTTAGSIGLAFADVENGYSIQAATRLLLAVALGDVSGGPGAPVFKSLDGLKDRVTGTALPTGDRTRLMIDAS